MSAERKPDPHEIADDRIQERSLKRFCETETSVTWMSEDGSQRLLYEMMEQCAPLKIWVQFHIKHGFVPGCGKFVYTARVRPPVESSLVRFVDLSVTASSEGPTRDDCGCAITGSCVHELNTTVHYHPEM